MADAPAAAARSVVCNTSLGRITLKITLAQKFLDRPLEAALLKPFLGAYNKKMGNSPTSELRVSDVEQVTVDGAVVDPKATAGSVLPNATHTVTISPSAAPPADISDAPSSDAAGASSDGSSDVVSRVVDAPHEFAVLDLPLAKASVASVRKAYRKVSLLVHPDKVTSPRASEAFRKTFDAMQLLIDPGRQAVRLRQLSGSGAADGESALPPETRWWEGASVGEMEQAFRNLEEFLEARGAFGEDEVDDHLWVDAAQAERIRRSGLAFFVDSRDTPDYDVSHVKDALSLPGHTTNQLEGLLAHPAVVALARSPASIVIVYSDNGSKLSRCVNVSRILRHVIQPERVRR